MEGESDEKGHLEMAASQKEKLAFAKRLNSAISASDYSNLSNKELGKKFGRVSDATVSNWRNGIKFPSMANGIILAKALDVAFEWLMTGRGDRRVGRQATPEAEAMLLLFESLSPEERAQMLMNAASQAWAKGDNQQADNLREMADAMRHKK